MRYRWMIPSLIVILISGSWLLAQTATPTDELACDPDELIAQQMELAETLDAFAEMIEDDTNTAMEQLYTVGQTYQQLALECGYIPDDIGTLTVGEDMQLILRGLENVNGDPLNGQLLYNNIEPAADGGVLGCVGCHSVEEVAPLTEGTWTRWDEIRSEEPQFVDYTFEQYMVESIIHPWDYTVPDYPESTMPNNFGERLNYQNLADIIAYLFGQDQFLD